MFLKLLDHTSAPVQLAERTLSICGLRNSRADQICFYTGDKQRFPEVSCVSNSGCLTAHKELARKAESFLADGRLVVSVTMRSRSFAELAVPTPPPAQLCPALIAKTLPAPGSDLAAGVDVVFKAAGERLQAHSYILALRSSTLRASLWGPLAANRAPSVSQPRELDVPEGVDTATFKRALAFMYTDVVPELETPGLSANEMHALLHAADYMDVPGLRLLCVSELHKRLAPDNAAATLQLAHALSCTPLLDATLRFIAANAPAVMRAPD